MSRLGPESPPGPFPTVRPSRGHRSPRDGRLTGWGAVSERARFVRPTGRRCNPRRQRGTISAAIPTPAQSALAVPGNLPMARNAKGCAGPRRRAIRHSPKWPSVGYRQSSTSGASVTSLRLQPRRSCRQEVRHQCVIPPTQGRLVDNTSAGLTRQLARPWERARPDELV